MRHFFEPWVTTFFEIDAAPPQIRQRVTAFQIDFFLLFLQVMHHLVLEN